MWDLELTLVSQHNPHLFLNTQFMVFKYLTNAMFITNKFHLFEDKIIHYKMAYHNQQCSYKFQLLNYARKNLADLLESCVQRVIYLEYRFRFENDWSTGVLACELHEIFHREVLVRVGFCGEL